MPETTLRVAVPDLPVGFDPAMSPRLPARGVMDLVYSTLTRLDVDGLPGPGLAVEFGAASDGRSWTFRLRPGVRFHDGAPLTPDDVAFSLHRVRALGRDYTYWAWIDAISAVTA